MGSRIDIRVGTSYAASAIAVEEGSDINVDTPYNASQSAINSKSNKAINLNTSNDLFILGSVNSLNIGV